MASIEDSWFLSAKQGRDDDLTELVSKIKDVNVADPLGNTALHYSAHGGHTQCVKILLGAKGVKINLQNHLGETALHKASFRGAEGAVQELVAAGADLNIKNKQGQTAKDLAKNAQTAGLLSPVPQKLWDDDDEDEDPKKKNLEEDSD